jgi:hypothetical protein
MHRGVPVHLAEERPADRASILIDHADPRHPVVVRGLPTPSAGR